MKRFWLILCISSLLVVMGGCGSDDGDDSGDKSAPKGLFSYWTKYPNGGYYLDLSHVGFDQLITIYMDITIPQSWIDVLDGAGRDTTGLYNGIVYNCEMSMYVIGTNTAGLFALNHSDIDTPGHNACLVLDGVCSVGSCNYDADHVYVIEDDLLTIDFFGTADGGIYGFETFE